MLLTGWTPSALSGVGMPIEMQGTALLGFIGIRGPEMQVSGEENTYHATAEVSTERKSPEDFQNRDPEEEAGFLGIKKSQGEKTCLSNSL